MFVKRVQWLATCLIVPAAVLALCMAGIGADYPARPQAGMEATGMQPSGAMQNTSMQPSGMMERTGMQSAQQGTFQPRLVDSKPLIGHEVVNQQNEKLGTVKDVVLNSSHDRVAYIAVATGGTLGIGEKHYAVPWEAFDIQSPSRDKVDKVVLNASKQDFDSASTFDTNHWPDRADTYWDRFMQQRMGTATPGGISSAAGQAAERGTAAGESAARTGIQSGMTAAGQAAAGGASAGQAARTGTESGIRSAGQTAAGQATPGYQPTGQARMETTGAGAMADIKYRRLSELKGLDVKNPQNDKIGDVDEVVFDQREGRPVFAILSFGGVMGMGEKLAAVPWSAVQISPRDGFARLNADKSLLESIAYDRKSPIDLSNMSESQRLYQRFNQQPYWENYGYVAPSGGTQQPTPSGTQRPSMQPQGQQNIQRSPVQESPQQNIPGSSGQQR